LSKNINLIISNKSFKYLFFLSGILFFIISFLNMKEVWKNLLFHSSIEAIGATVAIILSMLLLTVDTFHKNEKYILLGIAFLGMGILDGLHSILAPGNKFVFFHSIASLFASVFAVLIWSETLKLFVFKHKSKFILASIILILSLLLFSIDTLYQYIPAMLDSQKKFTESAISINTLAGIFFILTSVRLLLDYIKNSQTNDFLFFILILFFGIAELTFNVSSLWQYDWWLWHYLRIVGYMVVLFFIVETIKEQKNTLDYQAHYDLLTGLPNRVLLYDRLEQSLEKGKLHKTKIAVFFIDLDHFKSINDSFGHNAGDEVLKIITKRLLECIEPEDTLARLGGDEFVLILEDVEQIQDTSLIANKLLKKLALPLNVDNNKLYISSSIGISIFPNDGSDTQSLLKFADSAMYKAKDEGRNNYQYYDSKMTELAFERIVMETSLRNALDNEEFVVYYQPQVDGRTDKLIGMEALVRWRHPTMGLVSPAKFIPLAEATGIIVALDRYVMKTAMTQIAQWYKEGLNPGVLAMNLAMKQLKTKDFIDMLKNLLIETQCKPQWIELEVTESQIMSNPEDAIKILKHINTLGIELAVDDFGTGYSSLAYLKRLPINKLKIDQEFVRNLPEDTEDAGIAKAVIALSQSLNLRIIAEGVETKEQKDFMVKNSCNNIQGYFYSKPVPKDEIEILLNHKNLFN